MHPALLLRRKKMKKEKKKKPSPLSRFLCRVRLRGMGARELPCAFFRGPSRTTCCPPSRELFVENAMTKELKKERKIRALTKQGAEPKKKEEKRHIYIMWSSNRCTRCVQVVHSFFWGGCLRRGGPNLSRGRTCRFPEPSALVVESLLRHRVVHGCFCGFPWERWRRLMCTTLSRVRVCERLMLTRIKSLVSAGHGQRKNTLKKTST